VFTRALLSRSPGVIASDFMTDETHLHRHAAAPEPRWCSCAVPDEAAQEHRSGLNRRGFLTVSRRRAPRRRRVVATPEKASAAAGGIGKSVTITIMGTSDLHSHALNWDYYTDAAYSDKAGNVVGLSRVASVVKQIRADRGRDHTLLFDAGDTIQGTPWASTTRRWSPSRRPVRPIPWPRR
jgi:2',3'-cyclic-nucleotide 2'-phosphodiesterase/3'-nucleotidase